MITNDNKLLVRYLFPNKDCLIFFKEQLFEELKEIIPEKLCYSDDNKKDRIRNSNNIKCISLIKEFFINNPIYKDEVEYLYKKQLDEIIDDILNGFVFLLKGGINIIEDNKSVCYVEGINIFDLLI